MPSRRKAPFSPASPPTRGGERFCNLPFPPSGFLLFLGVRGRDPCLGHHNIFFSDHYPYEFDEIHERKISPTEPTIYISVSARTDPAHAPPDHDNYFVLINAPRARPKATMDADRKSELS